MAKKSKYEDDDFIISELCTIFSDEDMLQLANVNTLRPTGMSKEDFQHCYSKHLKLCYLRARQKGNSYKKISFSELNKKIVTAIRNNSMDREYPLLPKENNSADSRTNKERIKALTAGLCRRQK